MRNGSRQPQYASSAIAGLRSLEFGLALFEALDTPIGSLSEYEPILKIFAIHVKFSAVQSIKLSLWFCKCIIINIQKRMSKFGSAGMGK
jgi:hypothetical protein